MKSTLRIKELSRNDELDRQAMSAVRGGIQYSPVSEAGPIAEFPEWPAWLGPNPFTQLMPLMPGAPRDPGVLM